MNWKRKLKANPELVLTMTREEMNRILNQQYQDLAEEFQRLNVPIGGITSVTVNGRLKTTMGRCFHSYVPYTGITTHRIEINKECFTNPDVLRDTLAHEMCHAIDGSNGHDEIWWYWVGFVNKNLGTHITKYYWPEWYFYHAQIKTK